MTTFRNFALEIKTGGDTRVVLSILKIKNAIYRF